MVERASRAFAEPASSPDARGRAAADAFAALLYARAFAPVARALGWYGDVVVGEVARCAARGSALSDAFAWATTEAPR